MKTQNPFMVDVLIQGAGLGGLTTALALKKQGLKVLVLEKQASLSEVGAGIWMAPNALQVFKGLGLDQKIASAGWPIQKVILKDSKFRNLQVSDLTEAASIFGFETIAIQRQALQKILFDSLNAGEVVFGDEVESLEQNQNEVRCRLKRGSTVVSKLLIGADGIHSQVREQIQLGAEKRYTGTSSFRGIAKAKMPAMAAHESWEIWAGEHRVGFSQVNDHELYWYLTFKSKPNLKSDATQSWKDAEAIFHYSFKEFAWVIQGTEPGKVIRTDLSDLVRIRSWSKERVGLLGDAAHATTPNLGQGGAMAIEDAHTLSECIRKFGLTSQAFIQFETRRRDKVDWTVSMSWKIGQMAHVENRFLCAIRDFALRSTPAKFAKKQWVRMYQLNRL